MEILAAILVDVFGQGVEGPVRGCVGQVQEEGILLRGFAGGDERHGQ